MTVGLALIIAGVALILWALPGKSNAIGGTINGGTAPSGSGASGGTPGAGSGGGGGGSW